MSNADWYIVKAVVPCLVILSIPLIIIWWNSRRLRKIQEQLNEQGGICAVCRKSDLPLHYVEFHHYEGGYFVTYITHNVNCVLCKPCTQVVVKHSRNLILSTFWRTLRGPLLLIITYWNGSQLLRQVSKAEKKMTPIPKD